MPDLAIVLTDDWELRGDGSGDVEKLQRTPALKLMDLYEAHGIRSTFNAEVMQQLAFERYAAAHPDIARQRDLWKQTVTDFVNRGFDVQLHVHPQWYGATFDGASWSINDRWHIVDYELGQIREMVRSCYSYLAQLISPRKIVSFRGGSWGMGPPSRDVLQVLIEHGIRVDMSVVNGSLYRGQCIQLDYTDLESPYAPYYPDLDDIRRVSPDQRSLIEIPTQSVPAADVESLFFKAVRLADRITLDRARRFLLGRVLPRLQALAGRSAPGRQGAQAKPRIHDPFGFVSGRSRTDYILDISLDYRLFQFKRLVDRAMQRAIQAGGPSPAVLVLENHTKDLQSRASFERIDALLHHIKDKYPGTRFMTITEASQHLLARG